MGGDGRTGEAAGERFRASGAGGGDAAPDLADILWRMGHGFVLVDPAWRIAYLNAAAERLLGPAAVGAQPVGPPPRRPGRPGRAPARGARRGRARRRRGALAHRRPLVPAVPVRHVRRAHHRHHRRPRAARPARPRRTSSTGPSPSAPSASPSSPGRSATRSPSPTSWTSWPTTCSPRSAPPACRSGCSRTAGRRWPGRSATPQAVHRAARRAVRPAERAAARPGPVARAPLRGERRRFRRAPPELAGIPELSGKQAWAFLPLVASGQRSAAASSPSTEPRRFTAEERDPAHRAQRAGRPGPGAGPAVRRRARPGPGTPARAAPPEPARRCPPSPPPPATCPAGEGMEVGGDWYDVIPLSADRVALVIGDVMGHGVSEAATMGRLRTAVHTLADLELPPDELLTHLNDLVGDLGDDFFATCLYADLRPDHRAAPSQRRAPAAGHRAPRRHRCTSPVDPDPPLGAADPPFETIELSAAGGQPPGAVHRRPGRVRRPATSTGHGATSPASLTRLPGTPGDRHRRRGGRPGPPAATPSPPPCCPPADRPDDAALLVARTARATAGERASVAAARGPRSPPGQARRHVREQLDDGSLERPRR